MIVSMVKGQRTGGSAVVQTHKRANGLPDALGGGLDFAVPEMGVAQGHAYVGMPKEARDHRHGHAVHDRVARMRMTQVVQADILDAGFPADAVPEREVETAGPGGVERRRKHERASASRLAFQDAPGLGVEGHGSRPGFAVGKDQLVLGDFRPAQPDDLAPAAPGEEEKPDYVGLLPAALAGLHVEGAMEAADLLPGQKAGERGTPVPLHAPCRVRVDVPASDGEVHDLPEDGERIVGIAWGGPAERIEPAPDLCRGDAIQGRGPNAGSSRPLRAYRTPLCVQGL